MENGIDPNMHKRVYLMALNVGLLFAIPAIAAALIGKKIDAVWGTTPMWTISLLAAAFVLSWGSVIWKYNRSKRNFESKQTNNKEYDGNI